MTTFDFSNPKLYNPAFIPLMQNESEFLHLWGSGGSGKSRFEAQKEIVKSFSPKRRGRRTIIVRKVFDTLRESCYAELEAVANEWKIDDCFHMTTSPLRIVNKVTNVTFSFRGFDNPEKIKSIVGADRAWYEETTESADRDEITLLRGRLRGFRKVQLTCTYNPIDEHHWINEEIHDAENHLGHYLHHSTYKDNIRMLEKDPNYETWIEGTKETDPNYYRVYGLGLWGQVVEGLIYPHVRVIDEFPKRNNDDDVHQYGLDFGYSDPTALIAQHVKDALPKKKLINKELIYKVGLDGPALVREMEKVGVRKDILIIADSARPEMIRTVRNAGYNIRGCVKFAGSVLSGINDVRKFDLEIVAGSKELIKESRNYHKRKLKGVWVEVPDTVQVDHGMDAIRYAAQKAIVPTRKGKRVKTSSQSAFE